ncbi:MAG: hypothetical protein ACOX4U_01920 [Anaerovoracaceae bacterium]|jgi:hypothetical protein
MSFDRITINRKDEKILQSGFLSLILIFIVLCLAVLSILALSSSIADSRLAHKSAEAVQDFYKADGLGEEWLKDVNYKIAVAAKSGPEGYEERLKSYFGENYCSSTGIIKCAIPLNDRQVLSVEVERSDRERVAGGQKNYRVELWKIINTQEHIIDDSIKVWSGGDGG